MKAERERTAWRAPHAGGELHSSLPVPPGAYLAEVLSEVGMSQTELARRMGRPTQMINELIHGKKELTAETARQLEPVLGVPADVWLGLEKEYRLALALRSDEEGLREDEPRAGELPYAEMARLGWVEPARSPRERVRELRRFFGVSSLANVPAIQRYAPAFRVGVGAVSPLATAAWLRAAERIALNGPQPPEPFDPARLRRALPALRRLTLLSSEEAIPRLQRELGACGVTFALVPHITGTRAQGAVLWPSPRRPLVALSLRYRWADIFWFTLFHELGHLFQDRREDLIDVEAPRSPDRESIREQEADRFAREQLIPEKAYQGLLARGPLTEEEIRAFGTRLGIHSGLVVGRLQHDGHLPHSRFNHLRARFHPAQPGLPVAAHSSQG